VKTFWKAANAGKPSSKFGKPFPDIGKRLPKFGKSFPNLGERFPNIGKSFPKVRKRSGERGRGLIQDGKTGTAVKKRDRKSDRQTAGQRQRLLKSGFLPVKIGK
jgi:hypothetical protein